MTYSRDAPGNITSVSTTFDGTTQTLADNISYAPFGPVKSMDFSNGKTETRSLHDAGSDHLCSSCIEDPLALDLVLTGTQK